MGEGGYGKTGSINSMTNLKRVVRRETAFVDPTIRRPLLIILEPPDLISLKEKGRRKAYSISASGLYTMLVKQEVEEKLRERRRRRRQRRRR